MEYRPTTRSLMPVWRSCYQESPRLPAPCPPGAPRGLTRSLLCGTSNSQHAKSDLAVQILIGPCHIAAAEPDPDFRSIQFHFRIADHFRIPGLRSAEDHRQFRPAHAIGGACQSQPAHLARIAAGVEHPVKAVRNPDGRLSQTVFIEGAAAGQLEHRI